jgi:nifR3 family TIM-barrel protein
MCGFWDKFNKPFFVLAPMADVTDAAFRRIIAKYSRMGEDRGGPGAMWTEFVSADGLMLADVKGREKLKKDLIFSEAERPVVAQFFTAKPEMMRRVAELAAELGFDGVDINMGCPDRSIEKQGAGAALIRSSASAPELIRELIQEAKKGAPNLPISVKTRIGYNKNEINSWIPMLLSEGLAALGVHLRTRREMSKVPAHWELASQIVSLRDRAGVDTLVLGNGDVLSLEDAEEKAKQTGLDGIMLGKAIFGNPWLFDRDKKEATTDEKLRVMVEHTKLFEELLGGTKNFALMKKHYKAYVNDFDGAKELRVKLMEAQDAREVETIANQYLSLKNGMV